MTSVDSNLFANIIPSMESLVEKSTHKKIHPDILIDMPHDIGSFSKNFIILTRNRYQNAGISSFENNYISFEESNKSISLKKRLYHDHKMIKCYIAFDVHRLTKNEVDCVSEAISSVTGKIVYLNRDGRKHPNFENLFDIASVINLFDGYTEHEKIEYAHSV